MTDISIPIISAVSAIVGVIIGGYLNDRHAEKEREEAKREKRRARLVETISSMVELFSTFQGMIVERDTNLGNVAFDRKHSEVVGKAIGLLLATGDNKLEYIALKKLVPYLVDDPPNPETHEARNWWNINRNAFVEAIKRLAELITAEYAPQSEQFLQGREQRG